MSEPQYPYNLFIVESEEDAELLEANLQDTVGNKPIWVTLEDVLIIQRGLHKLLIETMLEQGDTTAQEQFIRQAGLRFTELRDEFTGKEDAVYGRCYELFNEFGEDSSGA